MNKNDIRVSDLHGESKHSAVAKIVENKIAPQIHSDTFEPHQIESNRNAQMQKKNYHNERARQQPQ